MNMMKYKGYIARIEFDEEEIPEKTVDTTAEKIEKQLRIECCIESATLDKIFYRIEYIDTVVLLFIGYIGVQNDKNL